MLFCIIFFFKQKTAYEMRISDWSSDVCSSDLDGSLSEIFGGVTTSNGAAFSPDGRIFYHADTPTHAVRVYDVDAAAGTLSDGRIFHQFPHGAGRPGGAPVDAEGCYWSALWDGWRAVRLSPAGGRSEERRVGNGCVRTGRRRWSPAHYNNKTE